MQIVENLCAGHQKFLFTLGAVSQLARQMGKGVYLKADPIRAMVAPTLEFQGRCHHLMLSQKVKNQLAKHKVGCRLLKAQRP